MSPMARDGIIALLKRSFGKTFTTHQIAARFNVSRSYVIKVIDNHADAQGIKVERYKEGNDTYYVPRPKETENA